MTVDTGDSANSRVVLFTQEPPPAFRTRVSLVIMDVQVVAPGTLMSALTPTQFDVSIAGRKRTVVLAEFVHVDEGPITRGPTTGSVATCVFGFERSAKGTNAHYLIGVERNDTDKSGIKHPRVEVIDKALSVGRLAWRSRAATGDVQSR